MTMNVESIPVESIDTGERRRTDLGDIGTLAKGIDRVGLLEPIIVDRNGDDRYRLVAGARRLTAIKMLKWKTVPASLLEHLTEEQLREIELEENENRKSLTDQERAATFKRDKKIVEKAKQASDVLAQNVKRNTAQSAQYRKTQKGWPEKPNSTTAVAEALGTTRRSVERAQRHVDLAERYTWLQSDDWRQSDVLRFEQHLKKLQPDEQSELCDFIVRNYVPMPPRPDQAVTIAENMVPKTIAARQAIYELSKSADKRERDLAATRASQLPPMPDARIIFFTEAIATLKKALKPPLNEEPEAPAIQGLIKNAAAILAGLDERYQQLKKAEEQHVKSDLRPTR